MHNRPLWWYVCFSFHFFPCLAVFRFLAVKVELYRKLKEIGSTFSYAEILEDLTEIRAVELTVEGKRFLARTETMGNAYNAFKALKIRPPDLLKEIA
ncbi:hypothetical protein BG32_15545 [Mesotoga sp. HF07.pep.5.2.highcov]|uniref:hypothetical protein n=1 Tax=Mesotoga sp. HF07.pep.5.2.highcov TaxID=1462923 RepID=UPI000FF2E4E0|nr:hypothetical protein [Mesotoga sp. HF07.pep.5.2.highcov]RLL91988.1 hypothetical protein BG32_15545 [Mesotoga sp. HF07.pep.5.2.highcov]